MIKKDIIRIFSLMINASNASFEDSAIGPNLSPFFSRDKINNFCNDFNNITKMYEFDLILNVKIFLYTDDSFFFKIFGPRFLDLVKILLDVDNILTMQDNIDLYIDLFDFFDIVFFKAKFFFKNIKYNSFFLKKQLIINKNSVKYLNIKNDIIE